MALLVCSGGVTALRPALACTYHMLDSFFMPVQKTYSLVSIFAFLKFLSVICVAVSESVFEIF